MIWNILIRFSRHQHLGDLLSGKCSPRELALTFAKPSGRWTA